MKTIGIQLKGNEAILVVLTKDGDGNISQTNESTKLSIGNSEEQYQVKQFKDQIKATFDSIKPDRIGLIARNANGKGLRAPSPISFKLEGIIQLYDKSDIEIIWPQTLTAYFKKKRKSLEAKNKYQEDAFDLAYYLIEQL